MSLRLNAFDQPIGPDVPGWTTRPRPPRTPLDGRFCRVEPLDPDRHAGEILSHFTVPEDDALWTYLGVGPFQDAAAYRDWMLASAMGEDPLFYTIIDRRSGKAVGLCAYLRIDPAMGVIEIGHILFSPALRKRPAATEAMYLMMARAFDELGYRRYEWKCDSLNAGSRAAAQRLGFTYEGLFRQAVMYKGRSRDTAWFSIIDSEWPAVKSRFQAWLDPANFDAEGRQKASLGSAG